MKNLYGFLALLLLGSCFDCRKYYNKRFKPLEISGIIDSVYIDRRNHNVERIILKDGTDAAEQWLLGLYENAQKGDSIYKAKGSLAVYLYKKDTTLIFYPVCDGDTLK